MSRSPAGFPNHNITIIWSTYHISYIVILYTIILNKSTCEKIAPSNIVLNLKSLILKLIKSCGQLVLPLIVIFHKCFNVFKINVLLK